VVLEKWQQKVTCCGHSSTHFLVGPHPEPEPCYQIWDLIHIGLPDWILGNSKSQPFHFNRDHQYPTAVGIELLFCRHICARWLARVLLWIPSLRSLWVSCRWPPTRFFNVWSRGRWSVTGVHMSPRGNFSVMSFDRCVYLSDRFTDSLTGGRLVLPLDRSL
jgi:hypothetical protein